MADFMERLIEGLADLAAVLGPLLAPVPSVYIAWLHMTTVLLWDKTPAGVMCAGIELLGFAVFDTAVRFWRRKESLGVTITAAVFYVALISLSNIVIDPVGGVVRWYKGLLSLLPIVGALVWAVRSQSTRDERLFRAEQLQAAAARREERAEKRRMAHELKLAEIELQKVAAIQAQEAESGDEQADIFGQWLRWPDVPAEYQRKLAGKSTKEIQKITGKSEKTCYNWAVYAKRDHPELVSTNGSGPQ